MPFSDLQIWINQFPLLKEIIALKPVTWLNPYKKNMGDIKSLPLNIHDMEDAQDLMRRFVPFLENAFPEIAKTHGQIESPLKEIEKMKAGLNQYYGYSIAGKLLLKCDNELPIAGSIKARGGFYEVLHYAEQLALQNGLLKKNDDYSIFGSDQFRKFFSEYSIGVGSTGNLGLSIGIMGAKLG
ncbi:MAG: D-serine ammonia-lyase, partial [Ginsengibacter sp.]